MTLRVFFKIISKIFYASGIITMFVPMTQGSEPNFLLIPIGAVIGFCGILLMEGPERHKSNEDILDENIFEDETHKS